MTSREAGRTLDAEIAATVMGLTVVLDAHGTPCHPGNSWTAYSMSDPGATTVTGPPHAHYSTSIEAAWLVVEKMRADGWRWSIDGPNNKGLWDVVVDREGRETFAVGVSPTITVAICHAALNATASRHASFTPSASQGEPR